MILCGRSQSSTVNEQRPALPEDGEDQNGHYERDEGGGVASGVNLFVVGEV